jgi:hypothetical protein
LRSEAARSSFISSLSEDEQIDLVALAWLGRDDNTIEDWPALREEAGRAHANRAGQTANYLLGMPLLADYLEEGLSLFGNPAKTSRSTASDPGEGCQFAFRRLAEAQFPHNHFA